MSNAVDALRLLASPTGSSMRTRGFTLSARSTESGLDLDIDRSSSDSEWHLVATLDPYYNLHEPGSDNEGTWVVSRPARRYSSSTETQQATPANGGRAPSPDVDAITQAAPDLANDIDRQNFVDLMAEQIKGITAHIVAGGGRSISPGVCWRKISQTSSRYDKNSATR